MSKYTPSPHIVKSVRQLHARMDKKIAELHTQQKARNERDAAGAALRQKLTGGHDVSDEPRDSQGRWRR